MKKRLKKRSPQAGTTAFGGLGLSTASGKIKQCKDSVPQHVLHCQHSPFDFKLRAVENPSQLQKKAAGNKAGQPGNGDKVQPISYAYYTKHIDDCQYDPVDALLAQAADRIERAPNDGEWIDHFMIWLSLSCLKHRSAWPEGTNDNRSQ